VTNRSYTHPRFPDLILRNDGGTQFDVCKGPLVVESFAGEEIPDTPTTSDAFANRRAEAYFSRLEKTLGRLEENLVARPRLRDFSDEQVLNDDQMLDLWEKAQAMQDGPEKDALLGRLRSVAHEFESAPQEIVNRLLS
jgi:hypothetical protein